MQLKKDNVTQMNVMSCLYKLKYIIYLNIYKFTNENA
uniref:Uncharacterized protein n=1 Tax=Anguilla anguilla TaxID=7936 RepID=A0A0E9RIR9_ANGAN